MAVTRVTAVWSGFSGAPGYTSFHFSTVNEIEGPDAVLDRVQSFFQQVSFSLPSSVNIQVQDEVQVFDSETGQLLNYMQGSEPLDSISGAGEAEYAGPTGAVITWNTATISGSRRMRGRTFLVPMDSSSYEGDGTLTSSALGDIRRGADALLTDTGEDPLVIWSNPASRGTGTMGPVTGYRVPDMAAVLRSRRD